MQRYQPCHAMVLNEVLPALEKQQFVETKEHLHSRPADTTPTDVNPPGKMEVGEDEQHGQARLVSARCQAGGWTVRSSSFPPPVPLSAPASLPSPPAPRTALDASSPTSGAGPPSPAATSTPPSPPGNSAGGVSPRLSPVPVVTCNPALAALLNGNCFPSNVMHAGQQCAPKSPPSGYCPPLFHPASCITPPSPCSPPSASSPHHCSKGSILEADAAFAQKLHEEELRSMQVDQELERQQFEQLQQLGGMAGLQHQGHSKEDVDAAVLALLGTPAEVYEAQFGRSCFHLSSR